MSILDMGVSSAAVKGYEVGYLRPEAAPRRIRRVKEVFRMRRKQLALALAALMIPIAGFADMGEEPPQTLKIIETERLMEVLTGAVPGELGMMIFGSRILESGGRMLNDDVVWGFRVEPEDGYRTYRFELAEGLAFSDGTPITAENYVFSVLLSCSAAAAELGLGAAEPGYSGLEEYKAGRPFAGVRLYSPLAFSLCLPEEMRGASQWAQLDIMPYPIHEIAPECRVRDDGRGAYLTEPLRTEALAKALLDDQSGYLVNPAVSSGLYRVTAYNPQTREIWLTENEYRTTRGGGIVKLEDAPTPLGIEDLPEEPEPDADAPEEPVAETAVIQISPEVKAGVPGDEPGFFGDGQSEGPDRDPGDEPKAAPYGEDAGQPDGEGMQSEKLQGDEQEVEALPLAEEARRVEVRIKTAGNSLQFGDVVTLVAELYGYEGLDVSVQWQCDAGDGWKDVANATGTEYKFLITPETYAYRWRAAVVNDV